MGVEPTTATLARWRSTTELRSPFSQDGGNLSHAPTRATFFSAHFFEADGVSKGVNPMN